MDITKLSPAPLRKLDKTETVVDAGGAIVAHFFQGSPDMDGLRERATADARFYVLARNAFDVMMRRGWGISKSTNGWFVSGILGLAERSPDFVDRFGCIDFTEPFSMLVEADRWYKENVETRK